MRLILSRWRFIALGAGLCGLAGLILALVLPQTYEATVTLLVNPATFKEPSKEAEDSGPASTGRMARTDLGELMPRTLPVEMYRIIALSDAVIKSVVEGVEGEDRPIERLKSALRVQLVELGSRSPVRGTQYAETILFHAQAGSPKIAAQVARKWAEVFKQRVDELAQSGLRESHELIGEMWTSAKQQMEAAEDELVRFRDRWNLDLMNLELDAKQVLLTRLEVDLDKAEIEESRRRAEVEALAEQLAREKRVETLFKAPPDEAYWLSRSSAAGEEGVEIDGSLGLRTEEFNPVHVQARTDQVNSTTVLRGLEAERRKTRSTIAKLKDEIRKLQKEIAVRETEEQRLVRNVDTSLETYKLVSEKFEKAKIALRHQTSDLQIVGDAIEPETPIRTRRVTQVVVAFILGALVAGMFVVVEYTLRAQN